MGIDSFDVAVWRALVVKRPALDNDSAEVVISAGELRRLLEQVWERGRAAGEAGRSGSEFPDVLRGLFG